MDSAYLIKDTNGIIPDYSLIGFLSSVQDGDVIWAIVYDTVKERVVWWWEDKSFPPAHSSGEYVLPPWSGYINSRHNPPFLNVLSEEGSVLQYVELPEGAGFDESGCFYLPCAERLILIPDPYDLYRAMHEPPNKVPVIDSYRVVYSQWKATLIRWRQFLIPLF